MPDVFISHVADDDATTNRIRNVLTDAGISAWVDHVDSTGPGSDDRDHQIREALTACRCGLFVLSSRSAYSEEIRNDWQALLGLGKRLYIALIEAVPPESFPNGARKVEYVDLTHDFDDGMAELIQAIRNPRQTETPLPTNAQGRPVSGPFPRWQLELPLVGCENDVQAVRDALAEGHRVTVILGLSGVGKTRLAVEIANSTLFRNGVVWQIIAAHTTVAHLKLLLCDHLGLDPTTDTEMVWAALGQRQILVVLDNAEECTTTRDYAELLNHLDLSGGTRILMTTRNRWAELRDAKIHELRTPDPVSAVEILRAMARREPPPDEYSLNGYEEALAKAARYRPKLIWYAVRWASAYPPKYILEILETFKGADAQEAFEDLVSKTLRIAEHQKGWQEALAALLKLAVFRGSFAFDAARAIIEEPRALALLRQWGIVSFVDGRYEIDPLVRAVIDPDDSACAAHFNYYLALAEHHDQAQDHQGLEFELPNLSAAFDWAIGVDETEAALRLATVCSDFLSNRGRFEQRRSWFERLAAKLGDGPVDRLKAMVLLGLGLAYQEHPTRERRSSLQQAISTYENALRFFTAQRFPLEYAMTQNNLGIAYRNLAEIDHGAEYLRRAIIAFQQALRFYNPQTAPLQFAATQSNLGGAFIKLASLENRTDNLWKAVAAFRRALTFFTPVRAPLHFAATQNNLGAAYASLCQAENPVENLRRAISSFERALRIFTPQAAPASHTLTQNNLGNAFRTLADSEDRTENLRRAYVAFSTALRYSNPQRGPLQYALSQSNLGNTCLLLAEEEHRTENLRRAANAYQQALRIYTPRTTTLDYIRTQTLLGIVHKKLGDLQAATQCWREAEQYFRQIGAVDMADRMQNWIAGQSDPGSDRYMGRWLWRIRY